MVTWALDLDGQLQPWRAHRIIRTELLPHIGEVRWSACGRSFTAGTHLHGWWDCLEGRLPLSEQHIHCGLQRGSVMHRERTCGDGSAPSGMAS